MTAATGKHATLAAQRVSPCFFDLAFKRQGLALRGGCRGK